MKNGIIVWCILIIFVVGLFGLVYFLSPVWLLASGTYLLPNPPAPKITYGEFPFRLEYEINGEKKVIEDTIVCEYDGIGVGSNGKYYKWKEYLSSGRDGVELYRINDSEKIFFITASPDFYMGDIIEGVDYNNHLIRAEIKKNEGISELILADELESKYGIKIISWKPSEPIKNTFK